MQTSEAIGELATALAKAQASYGPIEKDKKVSAGPIRYTYADYANVLSAIRPALNANGLSVVQGIETDGNKVFITTRLMHASGQWVESKMTLTAEGATVQKLGSAMTYGRRYSFLAITGSAPTDEDDDGAAATAPHRTEPQAYRDQKPYRGASALPPVSDPPFIPPDESSHDEGDEKSPFQPELGVHAGEAMRAVMGKLRGASASKPKDPAPIRKAAVLNYLETKYADETRAVLARVLGRTFPNGKEILMNMNELEKLEAFVMSDEVSDQERHDTRD